MANSVRSARCPDAGSPGGELYRPREGNLGAADPQNLRRRSARLSPMQRPDARDRADRRSGPGAAHPRASGPAGARRAVPACASPRLAAERGHPYHLSPSPLALRHPFMLLGIRAFSTSSGLQATGRRRKMLWMSCPAALNQQKSAVIGPTRERGRIEFPIVFSQSGGAGIPSLCPGVCRAGPLMHQRQSTSAREREFREREKTAVPD